MRGELELDRSEAELGNFWECVGFPANIPGRLTRRSSGIGF